MEKDLDARSIKMMKYRLRDSFEFLPSRNFHRHGRVIICRRRYQMISEHFRVASM